MKIIVPETRGNKRKYHFDKMKVGEKKTFNKKILSAVNYWQKKTGNQWKFKSYSVNGVTNLVRIK